MSEIDDSVMKKFKKENGYEDYHQPSVLKKYERYLGKRGIGRQTSKQEARVFRCFGGDEEPMEAGGTPVKLGNAHRIE
jgi:hypothetical protein